MARGRKICHKGFKISTNPDYHEQKARRMALMCPIDVTNDRLANRIQSIQKIQPAAPAKPVANKPPVAPAVRSNIIFCSESVVLNWN